MLKKNKNIVLRTIHGISFLIDICQRYDEAECCLYAINSTGEYIWNHLDDCKTIYDIAVNLWNEIKQQEPLENVNNDVTEYVKTLKEINFIL